MSDIKVVEAFTSLQGEGLYLGKVAYFIRVQKCNLYKHCLFECDTYKRIKHLTPLKLSFDDICSNISKTKHLVITGGEPTIYNDDVLYLIQYLDKYCDDNNIDVIVEIETNGYKLTELLTEYESWLEDRNYKSRIKLHINYSPKALPLVTEAISIILRQKLMDLSVKLVVSKETLEFTNIILKQYKQYSDYIYLMPFGDTVDIMQQNYQYVLDLALKYNVRATTRLHIMCQCL